MRLDRRHRHLGSSARDQGGEDCPERFPFTGKGCAGEHEAEGAAGALNSCADAGGEIELEARLLPSERETLLAGGTLKYLRVGGK